MVMAVRKRGNISDMERGDDVWTMKMAPNAFIFVKADDDSVIEVLGSVNNDDVVNGKFVHGGRIAAGFEQLPETDNNSAQEAATSLRK